MTIQDITELLDEKIEKDENKIVVTFYEIRVKNKFLHISIFSFVDM